MSVIRLIDDPNNRANIEALYTLNIKPKKQYNIPKPIEGLASNRDEARGGRPWTHLLHSHDDGQFDAPESGYEPSSVPLTERARLIKPEAPKSRGLTLSYATNCLWRRQMRAVEATPRKGQGFTRVRVSGPIGDDATAVISSTAPGRFPQAKLYIHASEDFGLAGQIEALTEWDISNHAGWEKLSKVQPFPLCVCLLEFSAMQCRRSNAYVCHC